MFDSKIAAANRKLERLADELVLCSPKEKKALEAELAKTATQLSEIKADQVTALKAQAESAHEARMAQAKKNTTEVGSIIDEIKKNDSEQIEAIAHWGEVHTRGRDLKDRLLEVSRRLDLQEEMVDGMGLRNVDDLVSGYLTTEGLDPIVMRYGSPKKREAKSGNLPQSLVSETLKAWREDGRALVKRRFDQIEQNSSKQMALEIRKASGWGADPVDEESEAPVAPEANNESASMVQS